MNHRNVKYTYFFARNERSNFLYDQGYDSLSQRKQKISCQDIRLLGSAGVSSDASSRAESSKPKTGTLEGPDVTAAAYVVSYRYQ